MSRAKHNGGPTILFLRMTVSFQAVCGRVEAQGLDAPSPRERERERASVELAAGNSPHTAHCGQRSFARAFDVRLPTCQSAVNLFT